MIATISSQRQADASSNHFKSEKIAIDSMISLPSIIRSDSVDNPILKRLLLEPDKTEENIFLEMKDEYNRLYSFRDRWPILEIKPETLSSSGFFYLQEEDKVQCPFCEVIIYNWTHGDRPLREHMKKSPKCPFLTGADCGNIPIFPEKRQQMLLNYVSEKKFSDSVAASYKPKHPRMADVKRRILTYSGWFISKPGPQDLAECGLYYTGVSDVVTCFFCGGSLGNWEPEDNPWIEHSKFYPNCSFLALAKSRSIQPAKSFSGSENLTEQKMTPVNSFSPPSIITSEIIKLGMDIFPEHLVLDAVKRKGGNISSLQELCDEILELKETPNYETTSLISGESSSKSEESSAKCDALLCKLCMDRERGAVFQPCGHLVSCWECANLVSDCPVCRRPIIHKIKTYFS